jgi:release factor glutamine methyltransferase
LGFGILVPANIDELMRDATGRLAGAGVREPRRDAAVLMAFAIGRDRTFLIAHPEYTPTASEAGKFALFVARRAAREPLNYITGRREFYGLEFEVAPGVLIPRPETELIVEDAIGFLRGRPNPTFCEVGVGSGCIAVAILANVPGARAVALDVSAKAIETARRNARLNGVADRLELRRSDVFGGLRADDRFDAIVSNPPYVAASEIPALDPEVRDHEPRAALTDGADGLSIIRRLIRESVRFLGPGGLLLVEIGFGQAAAVAALADRGSWSEPRFLTDLQGIDRTLRVVRR